MKMIFFALLISCTSLNLFSMDRCAAWRNAMAYMCKHGTFDQNLLAQAEKQALSNGCRHTDMVGPKECKPFFDQAGAQSDCPYLYGASGPVPLYDYRRCHYTKFFENK